MPLLQFKKQTEKIIDYKFFAKTVCQTIKSHIFIRCKRNDKGILIRKREDSPDDIIVIQLLINTIAYYLPFI